MPLRRVEPYKPNPRLDRRESHQRGFYKGSFDKNGSEFLTCFMKKAIQIQPLPLQSSLKKFLASFPDIHMGTFCSGTDSPVPWDLSSISHTKTVTLKMCLNCTSNTGNTALRCQRLSGIAKRHLPPGSRQRESTREGFRSIAKQIILYCMEKSIFKNNV